SSSRRRHTRSYGDWSSDVCSSDLARLRRIDLSVAGREQRVHASIGTELPVTRQVARVMSEIFGWPELGRVHIDAHHHGAAGPNSLPGLSHQVEVALMDVTHGRHETDCHAPSLPILREPTHGRP